MKTQFLAIALCAISLAACSKDKNTDSGNGKSSGILPIKGVGGAAPASEGYLNGNCGPNVIKDYNEASPKCEGWQNDAAVARTCKGVAQAFLTKYPNINCQVEADDGTRGSIQARDIQNIIDQITNAGI